MFKLTPPLRGEAYGHAVEVYPLEACGLVYLPHGAGDYVYRRCENVSPNPERAFRICPSEIEEVRELGQIVSIVHSHPTGPAAPTESDMINQERSGLPWVIVVMVNGQPVEDFSFPVDLDEEIMGQEFRPGVRDCYTLIRKWWWQNKHIRLPEFHRSPDWWFGPEGGPGKDLYMTGFPKAKFRRLTPEEVHVDPEDLRSPMVLQVGDVGLGRVMSPMINHGVVYTGGQLMLHHLFGRMSVEEPVTRWLSKIEVWLRRDDQTPDGQRDEQHPSLRSPDGSLGTDPSPVGGDGG